MFYTKGENMESKYQKALDLYRDKLISENCDGCICGISDCGNPDGTSSCEFYVPAKLLQELVDRDDNHFAHILKFTKKDGRKRIIAFHSSQEADAFVEKNGIKSAHLDSIQFFNEGKE